MNYLCTSCSSEQLFSFALLPFYIYIDTSIYCAAHLFDNVLYSGFCVKRKISGILFVQKVELRKSLKIIVHSRQKVCYNNLV